MKKRLLVLPLLCGMATAQAQSIDKPTDILMKANELTALDSHIGTISILMPQHIDRWQCPYMDEEALYLDAIARSILSSTDGEARLLGFIEKYPHSAYLPYAQMRLGEWYFVRQQYRSAAYWFKQYDALLLPDEMAEASDYYLAFSLMRDGRDDEALSRFKPLRGTDRFGTDATFYSGYLLAKAGQADQAAPLLRRLINNRTYGGYAAAYLADALLSQGKYTEALEAVSLGETRSDNSNDVRTSLLRSGGMAAANIGERSRAISYLKDYVRTTEEPGRMELLTLGKELYESGRHEEAMTYLRRVSDNGAQDFMSQLAYYYEGLSQLSLRHTREAQAAFERAVAVGAYPNLTESATFNAALAAYSNTPGRLSEGTTKLEDYLNSYFGGEFATQAIAHLGDAYLNDPDVPKALSGIDRIKPLPGALSKVRERVRLRSANTLLDKGDTSAAAREYDDIIKSNSDNTSVAEAYFWKGEVAYRNGDYATAIASTRKYLEVHPSDTPINPNAYYNLGYAHYSLSQWPEASSSFREYLRVNPDVTADEETVVYNRLADIEVQMRRYDQALALYDQAIRKGGKEADYAHFKRGMTFGYLKKYREKADFLALLSGRFPTSEYVPEALFEQGRALSLLNDEGAAQNVFRRVFETYPNTAIAPKAGVQLALSYFNLHKLQEAARIYEKVIRKYPGTDEAKSALEDLKSISVDLNRVEEFTQLVSEVGATGVISLTEQDSLAYLAAERVIGEGTSAEGRAALDKYISAYPSGAFVDKAMYSRALLAHKDRDYRDAISILERLLPTISGNRQLETDALKLLAASLDASNQQGKAAEVYLTLARKVAGERSSFVEKAAERARQSGSTDFSLALARDIETGGIAVNDRTKSIVYSDAVDLLAKSNRKEDALRYAERLLTLPDLGGHARAQVVKALDLYDKEKIKESQTAVQKVINKGTTDTYWLARGFILLADTYAKQGDNATAKSYLESVKNNYTNTNDGIHDMIRERLSKL